MKEREGIEKEGVKKESSKRLVPVAIMAALVILVFVLPSVVADASIGLAELPGSGAGGWMGIAYILFGVSILVFVIMLTYILHTILVRMRVKKEDRIKEILKEAKRIEDKIKEEGLSLSLAIIAMLFTIYARI